MDDDEDIYDDCDFDDDAPEKTDDIIQELQTSSPSIKNDKISEDPKNISTIYDDDSFSPAGFSPEKPVTDPVTNELSQQSALSDPQTLVCDRIYERGGSTIQDPMNISANYEDDSFSPTGFSPEKPVTDTVQNELPHQSALSYPQVQHDCDRICEGGGSIIEDPVQNSANYDDDDEDFSLSGLSEILASSSMLMETGPHQVTTAPTTVLDTDLSLISDPRNERAVASEDSLIQHGIVKDAKGESPVKEALSAEMSMELSQRQPQLKLEEPITSTDINTSTNTGEQNQNQGSSSNQFTCEKLKDMMEDATFRAILFADSEKEYPRNEDMLKLMKAAASKSIISAQHDDDNDSVDSKGCARGLGYRSVTAGLKIADLRMKIRVSGSSSALRRSMGVDAVRRLSSFVNSPKSTVLLAATATAAASALSTSVKKQSLQSDEELQNIINSVLANLRRSFHTMVLDYTDDNTSVGTVESHKSKAGRSRSSSWKLDRDDSAIGSSVDSEMDRGNSSVKQKLQRCSSAPSTSLRILAQNASPRNAFSSENNILRLLYVGLEKNILKVVPKAPEKNIFKIIQSEHFIESSIYQWAKPKKPGVSSQHNKKSIKSGKGKSAVTLNNASELQDEQAEKQSGANSPQQPKKTTKTQTAAVSLKMTSPIFYKKKRLMEAAQFAKSVVESNEASKEGQWDASGTLSSPVPRFRIVKLLGKAGHDRSSDHDMKDSKATENDADNLKQAMAELEQITLRDIMRPLPDLRKNMTWTEIAVTSAKKRGITSPGCAAAPLSIFDVAEDVVESKDTSTVAAAFPTLSFSKTSSHYPPLLTRASTSSIAQPLSALGGSINGRGILLGSGNPQDGSIVRKRMPLLINVLSEKDLRKTRKVKP